MVTESSACVAGNPVIPLSVVFVDEAGEGEAPCSICRMAGCVGDGESCAGRALGFGLETARASELSLFGSCSSCLFRDAGAAGGTVFGVTDSVGASSSEWLEGTGERDCVGGPCRSAGFSGLNRVIRAPSSLALRCFCSCCCSSGRCGTADETSCIGAIARG